MAIQLQHKTRTKQQGGFVRPWPPKTRNWAIVALFVVTPVLSTVLFVIVSHSIFITKEDALLEQWLSSGPSWNNHHQSNAALPPRVIQPDVSDGSVAPTYTAFWQQTITTTTTSPSSLLASLVPKAPWNPATVGRGHGILQTACAVEIVAAGCQESFPLDECLRRHFYPSTTAPFASTPTVHPPTTAVSTNIPGLGESCQSVLEPCASSKREATKACRQSQWFQTVLTESETSQLETILALIDLASTMNSSRLHYWMTAGSAIGTVSHHSIIPWDDDVDIYVRMEHMDILFENIKSLGLAIGWESSNRFPQRTFKVYNASLPRISRRKKHTYPFVDVFPVNCTTTTMQCIEYNSAEQFATPVEWVFPLKRRPFGRMSMPFPNQVHRYVKARYGRSFLQSCVKGPFDHRTEMFFSRRRPLKVPCSQLILSPAFVVSTTTNGSSDNNNQSEWGDYDGDNQKQRRPYIHPWTNDFPNLSVEYLRNDVGMDLSAVVFDDGNEIRRYYRDGLLHVKNHAITYTLPPLSPGRPMTLVPFLQEERTSLLRNGAGRSAEVLNQEVLPTLDRVILSNRFLAHGSDGSGATSSKKISLRVGEWNAERGHNWDVFPSFYNNANIIILNEMDMGMARSGNVDTTKQMATALEMNYAYGVEFLELTNGNANEINATFGETNLIGYHGNAVLSKWPILESKVLRLHPLYDLLYEKKVSGQAGGERRLGGRMALFALVQTGGGGNLLVISMHAHSGSKRHLLKGDADLVCNEIRNNWKHAANVILGGDIARPIPQTLVSQCGFFALEKTNSRNRNGDIEPSWNVVCPGGKAPRAVRAMRGDWMLARGSGFDINSTKTSTIFTYRLHKEEDQNGVEKTAYECISDHALITLDVDFHL